MGEGKAALRPLKTVWPAQGERRPAVLGGPGAADPRASGGRRWPPLRAPSHRLQRKRDRPFGRQLSALFPRPGRARAHARDLDRLQPGFSPARFLATFGPGFAGVDRVAKALEALGLNR